MAEECSLPAWLASNKRELSAPPVAFNSALALVRDNQVEVGGHFEVQSVGAKLAPSVVGIVEQDILVVPHRFGDGEVLVNEDDIVIIQVVTAVAIVRTIVITTIFPVDAVLAPKRIFSQ